MRWARLLIYARLEHRIPLGNIAEMEVDPHRLYELGLCQRILNRLALG